MTKKKSFLAFVLAICLFVPAMLMLTACGNDDNKTEHVHTFSKEWTTDETYHWHKATCKHVDEKSDYVKHIYDDASDNDCNVCGFTRFVTCTDMMAEGSFEKGTTLSSSKVESTDSSYTSVVEKIADKNYDEEKIALFEISLADSNGAKIQPSGKVKITMPKPFESEHGYITYHIKDESTVEELETILNETKIVFETESFSYFIVVGKVPPTNPPTPPETTPTILFANTHADSLEHLYNGAAVFVDKEDIVVDGTKLSEITDENILNKISYVWRDKNTKAVVTPDVDITLTGELNTHYGVNRDITIGNEIAGPCVVGEYEFVLSYNGTEKLIVDAIITESKFQKIDSVWNFDATTAPTVFGDICYYTIVGYANGQMYVMQMPADSTSVVDENIEAEARLVIADENNRLDLGKKFDFVFTPMRYFENESRHYPETSSAREDLLVDFCTGYYGARPGRTNLAAPVINRIGWTRLSGDKIVREKGDYVGINYGNLTKFADDGAVTIYAPRKGETEKNSLRMVKDGDRYVFTGKNSDDDTRTSYPIYIYKNYVEYENYEMQKDTDLNKDFDNNPVSFNIYKGIIFENKSGDIGSFLKTDSVRFEFTDLDGNHISFGEIRGEDVFGPKEVGKYRLVLSIKKNNKWIDKAELCQFEIKAV